VDPPFKNPPLSPFVKGGCRGIIELDGGQHYSDEGIADDIVRDNYMSNTGLKVLRFSDREIFENLHSVVESIWRQL